MEKGFKSLMKDMTKRFDKKLSFDFFSYLVEDELEKSKLEPTTGYYAESKYRLMTYCNYNIKGRPEIDEISFVLSDPVDSFKFRFKAIVFQYYDKKDKCYKTIASQGINEYEEQELLRASTNFGDK